MSTFEARVVQFLMPDGRCRSQVTDLPKRLESLYKDMVDHGCRFEAEMLTTGEVSITITNEEKDVDISVTFNNEAVQQGMAKMLEARKWVE